MLCALVSAIFLFFFSLLKHISSCHAAAGPLTFITFSFPPTPQLTCMHTHWMLWNIWLALRQYASKSPGQETFSLTFIFFNLMWPLFCFIHIKCVKDQYLQNRLKTWLCSLVTTWFIYCNSFCWFILHLCTVHKKNSRFLFKWSIFTVCMHFLCLYL